MKCLWITLLALGASTDAAVADTATLPTNVRAFVYKHVRAAVPESFDPSGASQSFAIRETLGTDVIKSIDPDVAAAYEELHKIAPTLAEGINLGKIDMEPEVNVRANAFGLAWGLTDRLMAAVGIPIMSAEVHLKGGYFNTGSVLAAAAALKSITDPAIQAKAYAMGQLLEQLPTVKGEHLQGVLTNEFGYKPIGHWTGQGLGDIPVFLQAKTWDGSVYDNGFKLGVELPTGRKDDPDNLVDIPFGTGYFTSFIESLHDVQILDSSRFALALSGWGRFNYAHATDRTYRLAPSRSFPLTAEKESIHYKPGNSTVVGGEVSMKFFKTLGFSTAVYTKNKSKDKIQGARKDYDYSILEHKTDSKTNTVEATLSISTIELFLRKKFPVPFKVGVTAARVFSGRNTERVDQAGLNFEMYF